MRLTVRPASALRVRVVDQSGLAVAKAFARVELPGGALDMLLGGMSRTAGQAGLAELMAPEGLVTVVALAKNRRGGADGRPAREGSGDAESSFPRSGGGLEPHAMKAALVWLLLFAAPPTVAPAIDPAHPKTEHLVGLWHSRTRQSEGTVTIHRDGTFQYRPHSEPRTITGLWRLQGGAIVWSYTPSPGVELDPSAQPDVNPFVELSSDRFVLRETDDSLSVFTRLQPIETPESSMPDLAERLWAVVVVVALLAVAFVAWRMLRSHSPTRTEGRVYPCLKETAWVGRGPSTCRPLADVDGAEWVPWVAFGYDRPDTFVFLQEHERQESGRSAAELEAEALANLRDREASWQMVEIGLKNGVRVQVVMCTDDFFAAERILEPEPILEAQRRLGASALLAAVPRRGLLALMDADAGPEAIAWFVVMASEEHFGGQSAPISPMVFRMSGGRIVGALPSPPRPAIVSESPR